MTIPYTDNIIFEMDPSRLSGADGDTISSMPDSVGVTADATPAGGFVGPKLQTNSLTGERVLRFNSGATNQGLRFSPSGFGSAGMTVLALFGLAAFSQTSGRILSWGASASDAGAAGAGYISQQGSNSAISLSIANTLVNASAANLIFPATGYLQIGLHVSATSLAVSYGGLIQTIATGSYSNAAVSVVSLGQRVINGNISTGVAAQFDLCHLLVYKAGIFDQSVLSPLATYQRWRAGFDAPASAGVNISRIFGGM